MGSQQLNNKVGLENVYVLVEFISFSFGSLLLRNKYERGINQWFVMFILFGKAAFQMKCDRMDRLSRHLFDLFSLSLSPLSFL